MKKLTTLAVLLLLCVAARAQDSKQYVKHGNGAPSICPLGTVYIDDSTGHHWANKLGACFDETAANAPGGSNGQLQVNNAGSFGGITLGGDCTFSSPNITCTKTNAASFGSGATAPTSTVGLNILNLTNPSAISFVKIAADNTVSTRTPAQVLTDISAVSTATTVNGHALSANVSVTQGDVGLGSVTNDAQTKASIAPNTAPAAGQILVGNAGGTAYAPQSVSGDGSLSSAGAIALSTVNANVGTFGSATQSPQITVDGKGRITTAVSVTVTPAVGSVTGLGTGVATALGVNIGTAGAFVVNGGALGTPSSGVATNLTGTASGLTAGNVTGLSVTAGKTLAASNSLALAGTDGSTMTFPSSSATIARTDTGQTFSGNNAFTGTMTLGSAGSFQINTTLNNGLRFISSGAGDIELQTSTNGRIIYFSKNDGSNTKMAAIDGTNNGNFNLATGALGFGSATAPVSQVQGAKKTVSTNNAALSLIDVALPTLAGASGTISYTVYATDGTEVQVRSGQVRFSAVNKGGSYTSETAIVSEGVSASAGTLAATWGIVTGTNKVTLQITPNSSLTTTTYNVTYTITNNSAQALTIL